MEFNGAGKSMKKTIGLVVILLAVVMLSGCNLKDTLSKIKPVRALNQQQAKDMLTKFIKETLLAGNPDTQVDVNDIKEENGLYKIGIKLKMGEQEQTVQTYLTKDGKIFFPSAEMAMNIDEVTKQAQEAKKTAEDKAAEVAKEPVKNNKPVVDLFVMSYCPYGTQMEKGIIPVVEALGAKITFNLKFVSYTMHGDKEAVENMRQYCIIKNSPAKLVGYLKCFLKSKAGDVTDAEKCMANLGINKGVIEGCIKTNNEKFAVKAGETGFAVDKADNEKYGVQGSPTLVINGATSQSGRDSASILKAVCGAFNTPPAECKKALSATAPSAGFGEGTAAAGTATDATCN